MKYYTTRIATKQGPRYQIAEKIDPNGPCSWENLEPASPRLFRTIEECDAAVDEMNAQAEQAETPVYPINGYTDGEDIEDMVVNPFVFNIPKCVLPDPVSFQLSLCDELDAILAN